MRIDLHTHSTASDGTFSPSDLVRAAAAAGLAVVALTDHDTTGGWAEAAEARPAGLALVRGAELSCRYAGGAGDPISLHLLAYLFDPTEPALRAERARVRASRLRRAERMVDMLQADGTEITWEQVLAIAGGGTVGRPHIGQALIEAGYVANLGAAYRPEWIGTHGRYWVAKEDMDVLAAIGLVRGAGGVPVFAHPRASRRGRIVDDTAIAEMADAGLAGLEIDHTDHTADERRQLHDLADRHGLLTTGSSDFHGTRKIVRLGAHVTAPAAYQALVAQATGSAVLTG